MVICSISDLNANSSHQASCWWSCSPFQPCVGQQSCPQRPLTALWSRPKAGEVGMEKNEIDSVFISDQDCLQLTEWLQSVWHNALNFGWVVWDQILISFNYTQVNLYLLCNVLFLEFWLICYLSTEPEAQSSAPPPAPFSPQPSLWLLA